jgi:hypothetical protein
MNNQSNKPNREINNGPQTDRATKPNLIAAHSFNGEPMKEEALKKFVDGAITTAHNAARHFPSSVVVEDDSDQ